jgi:arylsulfatase A-like enzyme
MMASRFTNASEWWNNAIEVPASTSTLAHYLRAGGYHTVIYGKMSIEKKRPY